jgi:hypothetical protein
MKAARIIVPIAILGILGATTYVIYRYFKNKSDKKKAVDLLKNNSSKSLPQLVSKSLPQLVKSAENPFQLFPQGSTKPNEVFISPPTTPRSLIFQPMNQQGNVSLLRPKL